MDHTDRYRFSAYFFEVVRGSGSAPQDMVHDAGMSLMCFGPETHMGKAATSAITVMALACGSGNGRWVEEDKIVVQMPAVGPGHMPAAGDTHNHVKYLLTHLGN